MAKNLRDKGYSSSMDGYTKKQEAPVSTQRAAASPYQAQRDQMAKGIPVSAQRASTSNSAAQSGRAVSAQLTEQEFNRSTALQKSYGNYLNYTLGRKVTGGGFYSRPGIGQDQLDSVERLKLATQNYQDAMIGLDQAYKALLPQSAPGGAASSLSEGAKLPTLREAAGGGLTLPRVDPVPEKRTVKNNVNPALDRNLQEQFQNAYALATAAEDAYREAESDYKNLTRSAEESERAWKSTIRDKDSIQKDIDELDRQINELWKQKQKNERTGLMLDDPQGLRNLADPGKMTRLLNYREENARIDKLIENLRDDQNLLKEELEWSHYFQWSGYRDQQVPVSAQRMGTLKKNQQAAKNDPMYTILTGEGDVGQAVIARENPGSARTLAGEDLSTMAFISDEERETYKAIYEQRGPEVAAQYYRELKELSLNTRRRQAEEAEMRAFADSAPVTASVASVLAGPMQAVAYIAQAVDMLDGHLERDAAYNRITYLRNAARGEIAQNFQDNLGETWGKYGSFGYQTAMSMGDFLFNAAITGGFSGGNGNFALGLMGTEAAADATMQALDRGLSDKQAFALGTVAGLAEVVTEKVSLEALLDKLGMEQGFRYFLKNVFAEGSEELGSDIINLAADAWISKDRSEWQQAIRDYQKMGKTREEAFRQAWIDQLMQTGASFLGGALSGGAMAGGSLALNAVVSAEYSSAQGEAMLADENEMQRVISQGLESPADSEAYKRAKALQEKLAAGQTVTPGEAGRAYFATQDQVYKDLKSESAEIIGRRLMVPDGDAVLKNAIGVGLELNETQSMAEDMAEKYMDGTITAREAGEMFLATQKALDAQAKAEQEIAEREQSAYEAAELLGVEIELFDQEATSYERDGKVFESTVNGYFDRATGKIRINRNAADPIMQVVSHELTHGLEQTESYGRLLEFVREQIPDMDAAVRERVERYGRAGVELTEDDAVHEIVAEYVQKNLLNDEKTIRAFAKRDRSLAGWILRQIDKVLAKLGDTNAQERVAMEKARGIYADALREAQEDERLRLPKVESGQAASVSKQYSFAGEKALTADQSRLNTAREMEQRGASSEEIRQETGWFRGMDAKWRFEIDDSKMTVRLPEYDHNRLRGIIQHDALFEAYPDLKELEVFFTDETEGNYSGYYDRGSNRIVINKKYENDAETIKRVLLHEIQHVLQDWEGFARGATEEYWDAVRERGYDTRTKEQQAQAMDLRQELIDLQRREPVFWQEMSVLMRATPTVPRGEVLNWDTLESEPDPQEWVDFDRRRDALEEKYGTSKVFQFISLWDRVLNAEKYDRGTSSYELYRNTAGEIEARDTDDRRDLTAEERRSTRPDIDREDVVFAPIRFSITERESSEYKDAVDRGDMETAQRLVDEAAKKAGYTIKAYHGTPYKFNAFEDYRIGTTTDYGWFGRGFYFTTEEDVAKVYAGYLKNSNVIEAYLRVNNPFVFSDYPGAENMNAGEIMDAVLGTDNSRRVTEDDKADRSEEFSRWLRKNGYDGAKIWSQIMILDSEQAKRTDPVTYDDDGNVIPLEERFNPENKDIRYDITENEVKGLELPSVEGGRQIAAPTGEQATGEQTAGAETETDGRLSLPKVEEPPVEKPQTEPQAEKPKRKKPKPVAESKPIMARNWLNRQIMDSFGIRENKTEAAQIIQQFADKVLNEGAVTDEDVSSIFGQLLYKGVFEVFPDEYSKTMREIVTSGQIYATPSVAADFGDDWADFRRRAFSAGLLLTNTRSTEKATALGVDSVWKELSDMSPGLFPADEYDERAQLEKIVQIAEEGKTKKMSLPEYLEFMDRTEGQNMYEAADRIMDKIAADMRTFGEMAGLEIKLRDRTGIKIAEERERLGQKLDRQDRKISDVRRQERERFREAQNRARQRRQLSELQQNTLKALKWLAKNQYRAPETLRDAWNETLGDIDLLAVHAADEMHYSEKYGATYRDLVDMYKWARENDPNFMPSKELERIMSRVDGKHLEDLDVGALQDLYRAATALRTEFYNRNNAIMEDEMRLFSEIFQESRQEIQSARGGSKGQEGYEEGFFDRHVNREMLTPMNVLRRMVGWNQNSTFLQMAKQLERGEKDMRNFQVRAQRILESFLRTNEEWVRRADGQGKDGIWYEFEFPEFMEFGEGNKPIWGDTVKVEMTPMQLVHLYLESENYDNLRHMLGGRTFANKELYQKGNRAEAYAQGRTIKLAPETVKHLVANLTDQEKALAKLLKSYYNGFASGEINRVSNILYGYDKAMLGHYAPIFTNQNYVNQDIGTFEGTAAGVGNLKARQYSKNPSYNISALDAFERNVRQTSRFVGMAIPERNWKTLLNWQVRGNSMRDVITHKWGEEGLKYITNTIETLQGARTRNGSMVLGENVNRLLSNYISATFGANPGIVLKQAASYPQFAAVLGWSNIPARNFLKVDADLINAYTSELAYRQMGYATPETAQLKNNPGIMQRNKVLNFTFSGGAIIAMDAATVKRGWAWAENYVKNNFPALEKGTDAQIRNGESEFYKKVAEMFEDAVSTTQPMYDEMHRPFVMKEANGVERAFTMFKTVPLQQYNTLRRMWGEYDYARRQYKANPTEENRAALKKAARGAANSVTATVGSVLMLEGIELLNALWKNRAKGYRDEDDELTPESVAEAVALKAAEDAAGMAIGGKELVQLIENILMDKKWYGIEIPGGEQLNEIIDLFLDTNKQIIGMFKGIGSLGENGVTLPEYLKRHAKEYAGSLKDLAEKVSKYFGGLPLENVEKYIMGGLRFQPTLFAAVEEVFTASSKSRLKGAEGEVLERRIKELFADRGVTLDKGAMKAIAEVYAQEVSAVPTDTPGDFEIDGEKITLNEGQKLRWEKAWAEVAGDIGTLTASEEWKRADIHDRAKMLDAMYNLAKDEAKLTLFPAEESQKAYRDAREIMAAGANAAQWAAWYGRASDEKDSDKLRIMLEMQLPDEIQEAIFGAVKGTETETESGTLTAYGKLQFVKQFGPVPDYIQFVIETNGMSKQGEKLHYLADMDLSDEMKLGITATVLGETELEKPDGSQTRFGKLLELADEGVSIDDGIRAMAAGGIDEYDKAMKNGLTPQAAMRSAEMATQIKEGAEVKDSLGYAIEAVQTIENDQDLLCALAGVMSESDFQKVRVGTELDVEPRLYVEAKARAQDVLDAVRQQPGMENKGLDQELAKQALDEMSCSSQEKAVLWQLLNKSWKPGKNPYGNGNAAYDALHQTEEEIDGTLRLPSVG